MRKVNTNFENKKFNKLTAIEYVEHRLTGKEKRKRKVLKYLCECGNTLIAFETNVKYGTVKSCGCLKSQPKIHGKAKHRERSIEYKTWLNIRRRCSDPNTFGYAHYGGRGISVYEPWQNDFLAFEKYMIENLGEKPLPYEDYSIDRIDVNGNYEPGNLRWVDRITQANNKRKSRISKK
jgi:hypothetical protein